MLAEFRPALVLLGAFTLLTGVAYPAVVTLGARALFPRQAEGSLIRDGDTIRGSDAHRAAVQRRRLLLEPAVGHRTRLQRGRLIGIQPRTHQPGPCPGGDRSRRRAARGRPVEHGAGAGRSRHRVGQRARSAYHAGGGGISGRARRARPQPLRGTGPAARCRAHRGSHLRRARRAARQCAAAQPGTRRAGSPEP